MKVKTFIGMTLLAFLGFLATSQAAPLLTATADKPTAGENFPNTAMATVVVRSINKNELNYLNNCMRDLNIPQGAYERLLRMVTLPRLSNGQQWYFIRPALNPYCQTFYGNNGFRYWLVSLADGAYQIRYSGQGSTFRVLNTISNGYYDIAASSCNSAECFTTTMKYVGERYTPFQCSEMRFSAGSGGDSEFNVPCTPRAR
ncbi:hypothetical protein [Thiofilum flexile]|uniref:hypothetical protein n=1 Tax=Thiofilum flexile TaxID=125627 RepID=UPI0003713AB1|nr:hypothetical protein [Thiofilum flexile]